MTDYQFLGMDSASEVPVPQGYRVMRGWRYFAIPPQGEVMLQAVQRDNPTLKGQTALRIAVALDDREVKRVEVFLAKSGRVLGELDIRYAHVFQPFELLLSAEDGEAIKSEQLGLRLVEGTAPLWVLNSSDMSPALTPHLLGQANGNPQQEFYRRLASLDSLQFFGWQEGCVLNGLLDLRGIIPSQHVDQTIKLHLDSFFDAAGVLDYEDDFSRPRREIYGIECTLPFAALAQINPEHPALRAAVDFWLSLRDNSGAIQDADMLSAEGSYTVAYPMAQLAISLNMPKLREIAIQQLRLRMGLFEADRLALRRYHDGTRTFENWCRGVAWYLLGLARTLPLLPDPPSDLVSEFRRVAAWVVQFQNLEGIWHTFVDEPNILPDSSGSAGIAAALAIGATHGLLPSARQESAMRARDALISGYLTSDGFLRGVAQVNKGGEALQRAPYRVISQMGMGLLGQLIAAAPNGVEF